jgi:hypothetical protein
VLVKVESATWGAHSNPMFIIGIATTDLTGHCYIRMIDAIAVRSHHLKM